MSAICLLRRRRDIPGEALVHAGPGRRAVPDAGVQLAGPGHHPDRGRRRGAGDERRARRRATPWPGFSNEGMVTVAILYVVGAGVRETGGVDWIAKSLFGRPKSLLMAIVRLVVSGDGPVGVHEQHAAGGDAAARGGRLRQGTADRPVEADDPAELRRDPRRHDDADRHQHQPRRPRAGDQNARRRSTSWACSTSAGSACRRRSSAGST